MATRVFRALRPRLQRISIDPGISNSSAILQTQHCFREIHFPPRHTSASCGTNPSRPRGFHPRNNGSPAGLKPPLRHNTKFFCSLLRVWALWRSWQSKVVPVFSSFSINQTYGEVEVSGQLHARYTQDRTLGWYQGRSGRCGISGKRTPAVQSLVRPYTDCATPAV